jgi:integrase
MVRKSTKSDASDRTLRLPDWATELLARRFNGQDGLAPVFPNSRGGWRDTSNVARDIRDVLSGSAYAWVRSHTARRTVATLLDLQGMSARAIADQLGHARPSMTQDVYMGRRVVAGAASHLEGLAPVLQMPNTDPGATA